MTFLDILWIIVATVATIYVYFIRNFQYWARRNVPYFQPKIPFGNIEVFNRKTPPGGEFLKFTEEACRRGWKYFGTYSTTKPVFIPLDLDIIKCIMTKDFNHFNDRGDYYNEEDDPLSAHIFAIGGTKWKNLRTKLTPTFTSGKLKGMFHFLLNCGKTLEETLKEQGEEEPINIKNVIACFTTDVIGSCAFGLELNTYKDPNSPFLVYGKSVFRPTRSIIMKHIFIQMFPTLAKALHFKITPPLISKFYFDVVNDTVNYREQNNVHRNDFLQLLINMKNDKRQLEDRTAEDRNTLTMNEIVAQCYVFFLAGYETSSTTMSFALYELAIHPEIQEKVRREISEVLQRYNNEVSFEALKEMHYMQQVLDETLRKYPPLPLVTRQCVRDYKIPSTDVTIEKGTKILIPIKGIHYRESNYKDPHKFDPERFSPEETKKRQSYCYLPFGEGPRICIGMRFGVMQSKIGLVSVLRNFQVTLSSKTKIPIEIDCSSFTPSVDGGLWLNLKRI